MPAYFPRILREVRSALSLEMCGCVVGTADQERASGPILCEPQFDGFVDHHSFELIQRKNIWQIQNIWKTHLPLHRGRFPPKIRAKTQTNPSARSTTEPPRPPTATGGRTR